MADSDLSALLRRSETHIEDQEVLFELLRGSAHRALAREGGSSLETTDLAHEVYLRLATGQALEVSDAAHLRRLVARVTRHVLVDRARGRRADKRGGRDVRVTYTEEGLSAGELDVDVLDLHLALERLETLDVRAAEVVVLRVFGGAPAGETASILGVSRSTVQSEWAFALTWLKKELSTDS